MRLTNSIRNVCALAAALALSVLVGSCRFTDYVPIVAVDAPVAKGLLALSNDSSIAYVGLQVGGSYYDPLVQLVAIDTETGAELGRIPATGGSPIRDVAVNPATDTPSIIAEVDYVDMLVEYSADLSSLLSWEYLNDVMMIHRNPASLFHEKTLCSLDFHDGEAVVSGLEHVPGSSYPYPEGTPPEIRTWVETDAFIDFNVLTRIGDSWSHSRLIHTMNPPETSLRELCFVHKIDHRADPPKHLVVYNDYVEDFMHYGSPGDVSNPWQGTPLQIPLFGGVAAGPADATVYGGFVIVSFGSDDPADLLTGAGLLYDLNTVQTQYGLEHSFLMDRADAVALPQADIAYQQGGLRMFGVGELNAGDVELYARFME